jgi:hypothetical protein
VEFPSLEIKKQEKKLNGSCKKPDFLAQQYRNERSCCNPINAWMEGAHLAKKHGKGPAGGPSKGKKTQEEIINRAMRIAAVEGLGALSIGPMEGRQNLSSEGGTGSTLRTDQVLSKIHSTPSPAELRE